MLKLRFIFIALITFLFVTGAVFWRKAIAFVLCGLLGFNSASYSFLDKYGTADAALPPSSPISASDSPVIVEAAEQKIANNPNSNVGGNKGVTVYIWEADYFGEGIVGHASMSLNDDNTYISWWPSKHGSLYSPAIQNRTFAADKCDERVNPSSTLLECIKNNEGKEPDHTIIIPCLDTQKIRIWWENFQKDNKQWVLPWKNCSTVVKEALYAGGAAGILGWWKKFCEMPFNSTISPTRPQSIFDLAEAIKANCSQCNSENIKSKSEDKQNKNQCPIPASSSNDPHLVTFDGLKYDLQTVGEFTLIKANHSDFEVQARQTPWNNSASVSINSAVAMKVGSDRVAIYAQGLPDADTTTPLRVNGKPTTIKGDKLSLTDGGEILKQGGTYVVSAPTGEKVLVSSSGSFLNISPVVDNRSGKYNGLLGNVNSNPNDDLQVRGGSNVLEVRSTYGDVNKVLKLVGLRAPGVLDRAEKVYFDQLYKQFANSWRVKQEESLFDYPAGKTTQSYVNPGFPDKYLTLNMLSADQIQKAQNACTEAKVTPDLIEGCIFDVGFSGFSEFARATAEINGYIGMVNQLFPGLNIPTPERTVNRVIEKVKPRVCLPFVGCH